MEERRREFALKSLITVGIALSWIGVNYLLNGGNYYPNYPSDIARLVDGLAPATYGVPAGIYLARAIMNQ